MARIILDVTEQLIALPNKPPGFYFKMQVEHRKGDRKQLKDFSNGVAAGLKQTIEHSLREAAKKGRAENEEMNAPQVEVPVKETEVPANVFPIKGSKASIPDEEWDV